MRDVTAYDPQFNKWTALTPLPAAGSFAEGYASGVAGSGGGKIFHTTGRGFQKTPLRCTCPELTRDSCQVVRLVTPGDVLKLIWHKPILSVRFPGQSELTPVRLFVTLLLNKRLPHFSTLRTLVSKRRAISLFISPSVTKFKTLCSLGVKSILIGVGFCPIA